MMISAVGRKKKTAASTHRLMEEEPLCAAAAIQRGPSTAAMLNSSTSQKPMARRSCDFGVTVSSAIQPFQISLRLDANERQSFYPAAQAGGPLTGLELPNSTGTGRRSCQQPTFPPTQNFASGSTGLVKRI